MALKTSASTRALSGAALLCFPLLCTALKNPRLGAGLGLALLGAASLWLMKKTGLLKGPGAVASPLKLRGKLQLSPRWSVAVVEVDGQSYLLTLGEAAAVVRRTAPSRRGEVSFPQLVAEPAREAMS